MTTATKLDAAAAAGPCPRLPPGGPLALVVTALLLLAPGCSRRGPALDKPAGLPPSDPSAAPAGTAPPAPGAPAPSGAPSGARAAAADDVETVPAPPDPKHTISGTVVVPAARRADIKKGETLFIIARRAGGPAGFGSMLAVQRLTVGDFPMPFALSARDAMVPGTPFEGDIAIAVRVDKDGDAITRRKGDVYGELPRVSVGTQGVTLVLGTLQTEDVTLGGGMITGGGGPGTPGHP